ncbi:MAG: hypothetical protein AAGL49_12150, partial [Pseudomonadota bacterium]
LVTASGDRTARLWDIAALEGGGEAPIAVLRGHGSIVVHAAFNAGGDRIVTASSDSNARLWDVAALEAGGEDPIAVLRGHEWWVVHAAFNADGDRLVTASYDGTARLWDANTGLLLQTLPPPPPPRVLPPLPGVYASVIAPQAQSMDFADSLPFSIGLALVALTFGQILKGLARLAGFQAGATWGGVAALTIVIVYQLLVYLTELPAESLLVWFFLAIAALPAAAISRLLFIVLVRPDFVSANERA